MTVDETGGFTENYVKSEQDLEVPVQCKYKVLNDKQLSGAKFGILFHSLCEAYPFSEKQLNALLIKYDVDPKINDYATEFKQMLDEAFDFKVLGNKSLLQIGQCGKHELEFNLRIGNATDIGLQISVIIAKHFGPEHPCTAACKTLRGIERGFLVGFIDLFFEHDGKYWVLDYKTNKLDNYATPLCYTSTDNSIIESMAEHHYYLQYLLYLVAVKRHLELRLNISPGEATELLGGAVYYFVRGVYTDNLVSSALYIDDQCKYVVRDIDNLFRGLEFSGK